jgi:hypothetical protein
MSGGMEGHAATDAGPTVFLATWAAASTIAAFVVLLRLNLERNRRERAEDRAARLSRKRAPASDWVD